MLTDKLEHDLIIVELTRCWNMSEEKHEKSHSKPEKL